MKTGSDAESHRSTAAEAADAAPAGLAEGGSPGSAEGSEPTAASSRGGPWPGDLAPAAFAGAAPSPESSLPFRSVGFTVSSIGYAVAHRFREILAPLELEPREFALLRSVSAAEGQTQHTIGGRLQIPPSRMVAFVDALEARGLLERRLNPEDRRTRALHLTDAGRDLLGRAFSIAAAYERNLCADLVGAEREQLLNLLQRVGTRLSLPPGVHAANTHSGLTDE